MTGDPLDAAKKDCRILLSELVKLAVDTKASDAELGDVAAIEPEYLYLTCSYEGTPDVIYCALWDQPHLLERYSRDIGIASSGAVHVSDLLPSGQEDDLRQEVLKKLWEMVMDTELPGRIDDKRFRQLVSQIRRHERRDNKRYFVVADFGERDRPFRGS